ncbi:hypothetical protein A9G05_26170 [Pseudomonas sp. ENNP23]|nr:hypothetical protein A9G05_26170 [Pseudomonas sp. ENNP23]
MLTLENFQFEGSVEALILAIGLRMVGAAEAQSNSQADQPDAKLRKLARIAWRTPRCAIVGVDSRWQAISPEHVYQAFLDCLSPLICTGLNSEAETRVVVDQCQGMALALVGQEIPFEVHLPEVVRSFVLKTLPGPLHLRPRRFDQVVAMQDVRHRTGRNAATQSMTDLAPTPGWMCSSKGHHLRFDLCRRLPRATARSPGLLL